MPVTDHRATTDSAEQFRSLARRRSQGAACIRLAQDNVSAHALARRFEVHPAPRRASWLNMAETLAQGVAALEAQRDATHATIDWRFSALDARTRLHKVYPETLNHLD